MGPEMKQFKQDLDRRNAFRAAVKRESDAQDALDMKAAVKETEQQFREYVTQGKSRERVLELLQNRLKQAEQTKEDWEVLSKFDQRNIAIARKEGDLRKIDELDRNAHSNSEAIEQMEARIDALRKMDAVVRAEVAAGKTAYTKKELEFARKRVTELKKDIAEDKQDSRNHSARELRAREAALEIEEKLGIDPQHPIAQADTDPTSLVDTAVAAAEVDSEEAASALMPDPSELDDLSAEPTEVVSAETEPSVEDPAALDDVSVGAEAVATTEDTSALDEIDIEIPTPTDEAVAVTDGLPEPIEVASEPTFVDPEPSLEPEPALVAEAEPAVAEVESSDEPVSEEVGVEVPVEA